MRDYVSVVVSLPLWGHLYINPRKRWRKWLINTEKKIRLRKETKYKQGVRCDNRSDGVWKAPLSMYHLDSLRTWERDVLNLKGAGGANAKDLTWE